MTQPRAEHFLQQQHVGNAFRGDDAIRAGAFHHAQVLAVRELDDHGDRPRTSFFDQPHQGPGGEAVRIAAFVVRIVGEDDHSGSVGDIGPVEHFLGSRQAFDEMDGFLPQCEREFIEGRGDQHRLAMRVRVGHAELLDQLDHPRDGWALADDEVVFEVHDGGPFLALVKSLQHGGGDHAERIADEADPDEQARVGDEIAAGERFRIEIPIPHGGHGDHRPPDGVAETEIRLGAGFREQKGGSEEKIQHQRGPQRRCHADGGLVALAVPTVDELPDHRSESQLSSQKRSRFAGSM